MTSDPEHPPRPRGDALGSRGGRRGTELVFVNVAEPRIRNNILGPRTGPERSTTPRTWAPHTVSPILTGHLTKLPRIHDLRHTLVSWMLTEGMDMFSLPRRLGHETYATTDARYSHLMTAQQLNAVDVAAGAMARLRNRDGPTDPGGPGRA